MVTLKCGQGHWKCYEQVSSMSSTIMQSLTFITFIVEVFNKPRHLTDKNTCYLAWLHTQVTQIILRIMFFMYVATTKCLKRTRVKNTLFAAYISDTPVTLKQSQGHQTYSDNVDPKQDYNHAKFKRSCFNRNMHCGIFMMYLIWSTTIQFQFNNNKKIQLELFDAAVWIKSSMSTITMQSLTFIL